MSLPSLRPDHCPHLNDGPEMMSVTLNPSGKGAGYLLLDKTPGQPNATIVDTWLCAACTAELTAWLKSRVVNLG